MEAWLGHLHHSNQATALGNSWRITCAHSSNWSVSLDSKSPFARASNASAWPTGTTALIFLTRVIPAWKCWWQPLRSVFTVLSNSALDWVLSRRKSQNSEKASLNPTRSASLKSTIYNCERSAPQHGIVIYWVQTLASIWSINTIPFVSA